MFFICLFAIYALSCSYASCHETLSTIYNVWFDFITSFSTFGQAKTFFNYHILMNIIVYMRFILWQKNILIMLHAENYHWTANKISN